MVTLQTVWARCGLLRLEHSRRQESPAVFCGEAQTPTLLQPRAPQPEGSARGRGGRVTGERGEEDNVDERGSNLLRSNSPRKQQVKE